MKQRPWPATVIRVAEGNVGRDDAVEFARALIGSLDYIRGALPSPEGGVGARLAAHLGMDAASLPGVVERFDASERVNVQVALDELQAERSERSERTTWELIGLQADIGNFSGFSITGLAGGRFGGHIVGQPVEYVQLPTAVDQYLKCFRAGLILTEHNAVPIGVLVFQIDRGMTQQTVVEVVGVNESAAAAFLAELKAIMRAKNVFRGKAVSFSFGPHGEFGLQFARIPPVGRSQVILPDADLASIEEHTLGVTRFADELLAAGQHLQITPLAAQHDQRGGIARPDDRRLAQGRFGDVVHRPTMRDPRRAEHRR